MHQPIHWNEWGEDAFAEAKRENKPMLLDIGAVWCHWCHVMDRESYDDPEIAAIVNEHFIAMKVDRDERPDIDSRYQAAVQAVSGQGGWPLTAFLTPDGKPFYGGTYFPPQDGYGRPSFRRVLLSIANAYKEKHGDVVEQAKMVESAIAQAESFAGRGGRISARAVAAVEESAFKMFDARHGGFGQAPKFPHPSALDLLIERYAREERGSGASLRRTAEGGPPHMDIASEVEIPTLDAENASRTGHPLHEVIVNTLESTARGGVYDQLAGGFHRYSVDERWVVPHFEKMCYDNSELLKNFVHAYQATGSQFFGHVARDIIRWMDEWLSDRERGGFYASQDADINMDDDGDYFTWTLDEARAVLSEKEAEVAALHYDINEIGEMHHNPAKNVLYVRASVDEIARRMNLTTVEVTELLSSAKKKMYATRLQRPTPYVDKTVYVGWNSLCVSAYLEAAKVLNLADARRFALRSLDRVLAEAWKAEHRLLHVVAYSDPKAEHREVAGMLEDYAFTTLACLDAYEATTDLSYFKFARLIGDAMIARFYDSTSGGFFDSKPASESVRLGVLAMPRKPLQDSPTPAGNPMAAIALLRLHHYTDDPSYRDKAEQTLEAFAGVAEQFGIFAATYGIAIVHWLESPVQVVVVAGDHDPDTADALQAAAIAPFAFRKTTLRLSSSQAVAENLPPVLASTIPNLPPLRLGKSFAVLCSGTSCQPPVADVAEFKNSLEKALQGQ
jgi:uncharacterized protein